MPTYYQPVRSAGRVTAYDISPYLECGVGFVLFDSPTDMSAQELSVVDRETETPAPSSSWIYRFTMPRKTFRATCPLSTAP